MSEDNNKRNYDEHEYQAYLDQRESLNKAEYSVSEKFDHWLITLSSGVFVLSITFIKNIAPEPSRVSINFLIVAWLLFIGSIVTSLYSLLTSQLAIRRARDILDKTYEKEGSIEELTNKYSKLTMSLNKLSIITFIIGLLFLAVFSVMNLYSRSDENVHGIKENIQTRKEKVF